MIQNTTTPLILVDGSSYLYRAFHAMPGLNNSHGEPTGAIYGVINMLKSLLSEYEPEYIAVVFDAKGRTFRDDLYDQYKANRPPMPDELRQQIDVLHEVIAALGLPLLTIGGVEADDVIGTLARQAEAEGMSVLISTGDKDLTQLVNEQITLINTMTDTLSDAVGVKEKFGVPPSQIIDYLALIGDTVDNVPGVPKVGPKTAVKWLTEYGSLDAIINNAEGIQGKIGENLRASLGQLPLSRQLVTIKCDVELPQRPRQLQRNPPDKMRLHKLFRHLEFKSWLAELGNDEGGKSDATKDTDYETVFNWERLEHWLERLKAAELFVFDIESTSLDYMEAEIVGISFAIKPKEAAYVPLAHCAPGTPEQLNREAVLQKFRPLLEDPSQYKAGQNLKYDMSVLANHGIKLRGIAHDTMLESYVLDSTATRHDMDSLALKYLGHKTITYKEVAGTGAKQLTFDQVAIEEASTYAAEDADITLRLHQALWPRLEALPTLATLIYRKMEIPLIPVLSAIERNGVLINKDMLASQGNELTQRLNEVEKEACDLAGITFNLGSPKQIQEILFERQGLPVLKKTPKGQPSSAEDVLQELAEEHPLPRLILEHRGLIKLKSTYVDKLPTMINPRTGRVHTSYHQAVAATGRLSSSDPNLQNIPVRTAEGRRIRQAFIAPPGYKLISADYSQIELRIMAHLSGDRGLLRAFENDADVHRATAAEVFGSELDAVTNEQRRSAKAINFGLIYGMSAFGLARQLGIDRSEAQRYIDLYFDRYPDVRICMDTTRKQAREQGYVETAFGRRLYIPEIKSSNAQRRQYAERTAINAPMQGTAADIIKWAMLAIDQWLHTSQANARMLMQVHDELVFEVAEEEIEQVIEQVRSLMEQAHAAQLRVALKVDVGVGDNWGEAH